MCKIRGVAGALYINKGQNLIIERRVSAEEVRKKTKEYQAFVLRDIFPERNLKKCINGIKNILTKNEECDKGLVKPLYGREDMVYTYEENFYYFLEEDDNTKEDI